MPTDYGATLNAEELNDLISFLIAYRTEDKSAQPKKSANDDDEEYDDD